MGIDEINAMGAGIACGGLEIESVVRKGSVVLCDSVTFPIEKVFVEFEDEDLAVSFEECVKDGTARIVLDEDTSINAAPKELQAGLLQLAAFCFRTIKSWSRFAGDFRSSTSKCSAK